MRFLLTSMGLVAVASSHLWCSSSTDAGPDVDAGPGSAASVDAEADADADATTAPECTDAFCRVAFPGRDDVVLALWARSAAEVWGVGLRGFAVKFDGKDWKQIPTNTKAGIFGVAGTPDGTVWGASSGQELLQLNLEKDGSAEAFDGGFLAKIDAIAARDAELVAVGAPVEIFSRDPPQPDNIWRYGSGPEGGAPAWTAISPPCPMGASERRCLRYRAVWIENAERQWFAGDDGKIFRTDTSPIGDGGPPDRIRLEEMNSSSLLRFNPLWGFDGNDIWAVGVEGVIRHWTGSAWMTVQSPVARELYGVWGSRPDDVWVVGDNGTILHWDGKSWALVDIPYAPDKHPRFYAVTGTGDDVWIAGEGALLRSTTRRAQ
ncbi:hypothetical protein AKJ09_10981 [Labilithrix luteola]|uniref:Type IV fimbrial biogenesis protein PilY1 n=1 Tax=Labilithrix luteola TaxID=1391654 RepID=A0A0K1QF18_9BACT|nr:hypothetical protein AKJ09_10981 [Labilithrix luteola]